MILENDIENRLIKGVKESGGLTFKFTSPGVRAVPDRIVLYQGLTIFVELKAPHRKLRSDQAQMQYRMINKGAAVIMINSFEKIDWLMYVLKFYSETFIGSNTLQEINTRFLITFTNESVYDKWMTGGDPLRGGNLT